MTDIQNLGAVPPATEVPESVREANPIRILQPRRPKQAAIAKPCRRIRPEVWGSLNAAIARERQLLAATVPRSPRVRPTLAVLRLGESAL